MKRSLRTVGVSHFCARQILEPSTSSAFASLCRLGQRGTLAALNVRAEYIDDLRVQSRRYIVNVDLKIYFFGHRTS